LSNVSVQEDDFYEIPAHAIKEIGREIGKGAFGRVYIAKLSEVPGRIPSQIVAIKKLKSKSKFSNKCFQGDDDACKTLINLKSRKIAI
jgi:serine/threonine protein kinase